MNVLSFSGGRTSAYMLYLFKDEIDHVIFCNTGKEAEGTLDFVRKCGEYFDKEIIWLEYTTDNPKKYKVVDFITASRVGEPFEQLIKKRNFLPHVRARFCSMEMKALTVKRFLKKELGVKHFDTVDMYLGIRADEPNRYYKLINNNRNRWENVMPLFKLGKTKEDVLRFWKEQPFDLAINPHEGNCDLCFLKGSSKKIELLRQKPEVAKWWISMEKLVGATFNKAYSIEEILKMSETQINMFDNDIDCVCNID